MVIAVDVKRRQGAFLVDMAFSAGKGVTALFGRSGSGKTSLISMIAGLSRPDQGHIAIDQRVLFDSARGVDLPPERRRIGYVFQEARLFPHLTVRGNLTYGMNRVPKAERYVTFDTVVELLGIGHLLDRRPARLSGGEKQRVAIGRALLASPRILLMDEPLAALDPARKAEVLPFIARLPHRFDIPILYVSHAMDEILRLADTLVLIDQGQVAAAGTVEDLMSRIDLRPLTGRYEAGAVVRATVAGHDDMFGMSHLSFAGGILKVGRLDLGPGASVRVRIHARDIALALQRPSAVSTQNIFPARVKAVSAAGGHLVDIALDVAGVSLWAQVTALSRAELNLTAGKDVFAMVKALSIAGADVADWVVE